MERATKSCLGVETEELKISSIHSVCVRRSTFDESCNERTCIYMVLRPSHALKARLVTSSNACSGLLVSRPPDFAAILCCQARQLVAVLPLNLLLGAILLLILPLLVVFFTLLVLLIPLMLVRLALVLLLLVRLLFFVALRLGVLLVLVLVEALVIFMLELVTISLALLVLVLVLVVFCFLVSMRSFSSRDLHDVPFLQELYSHSYLFSSFLHFS